MKKFTSFLLAFSCFAFTFGQVSIVKNKLYKDGQEYKMKEYEQVFSNEEARTLFKRARTNNAAGSVLGFAGGASMGFGIARLLSGNKATITTNAGQQNVKTDNSNGWVLLGIGAGIVGIGVPFAISAKKNADKAIALENGELIGFQPHFRIETSGAGFALSYNF